MKPVYSSAAAVNVKHFVYFSLNTQGKDGRQVLIDPRLLPKFLSLVDVSHLTGQRVVKKIEQLRAIGGGIKSHQHIDKAMQHMDSFDNLQVYYKILQQSGEDNMGPGVYITDINGVSAKNIDALGMYGVDSEGVTSPTSKPFFERDQAAVASGQTAEIAATSVTPHLDKDDWGRATDYSMFFIPESLANEFGSWITPEQKTFNSDSAASDLAKVLETTQKYRIKAKGETVARLRIFGNGSKLLRSALEKTQGHLDMLGFQFIDPTIDLQPVYAKLQRANAILAPKSVISISRQSQLSLAATQQQLQSQLKAMGRQDDAQQVQASTANSVAALRVGAAQVKHQHSYFLNAVTQANKLGKWS